MTELIVADPSKYVKTRLLVPRKGTGMPTGLVVDEKVISGGSNNRVVSGSLRGTPVAVRTPLSDSDTRRQSFSAQEAKMTLLAACHGIAPPVYDIWHCKTGTKEQRKGLHMIMRLYAHDLHNVIFHNREWYAKHKSAICSRLCECALAMARQRMFSYDIKSSNIVVDERKEDVDVRFIDFGYTYCELFDAKANDECPVLTALHDATKRTPQPQHAFEQALFIATLVLLTAQISTEMHDNRKRHNLDAKQRQALNPLFHSMRKLRDDTPYEIVKLVKLILRHERVRECTEHYNGRRNANVRRTFALANFVPSA